MVIPSKLALVTGANSGIGYAITQQLASKNIRVLMGSRSIEKGKVALNALKPKYPNIELVQIDITSTDSINNLVNEIKSNYGKLDILINNAGMAFRGSDLNEHIARTTINTNYYGTKYTLLAFLPIMKNGGRIVNVSSMAGCSALQKMSDATRKRFLNASSIRELDQLMEEFILSVSDNTYQHKGYPSTAYGVSKSGVTMLTRILAKAPELTSTNLSVTACCPGWVRTPMTNPNAPKSPEEGADTPVWLATSEEELVRHSGGFFEDRQQKAYC